MTSSTTGVTALTTHARSVASVERVAFATRLREASREAPRDATLVIETCHRVEAYVVDAGDDAASLARRLDLPAGGRVLGGDAAIRHAIAVAVGRDSVVVGEDQVLHQLRLAVDGAREAGRLDPVLERLFAVALRAGRRARSWRDGTVPSLADAALAVIEATAGSLRGRPILVVGAGSMGRIAATAAIRAGAVISVANRTPSAARTTADRAGARVEAFDPGSAIGDYAGVVVAIAGPWSLAAGTIEALRTGESVVVDLSVPAAVPAAAAAALGPRFVSADELVRLASVDGSSDRRVIDRLERTIDASTAEFTAWLDGSSRRDAAGTLMHRAAIEREAELAALWQRLPDLRPEDREAIEGMARHLADRLLREPLERVGRDRDGQRERALRDLFAL